jgi:hypothetical protein
MKTTKSAQFIVKSAVLGLFITVASVASAQVIYGGSYGSYQQVYSYPQNYGYSCPQFGTFYIGMRGYQVTQLQSYLASRGLYQPITGYYGPVTHANWLRVCGSSYNPYPQPYPQNNTTFRLDRSFTLYEGQTGRLSNGELEIKLNEANSSDDEARITVGMPCRSGTYCFYYPNRSYTLDEGDDVNFEDYSIKLNSVSSNRASFRVEDRDDDDDDDNDARIEITDPVSGDEFEQGDEMRIVWDVTDEPSDAEVVLELYDEDDDRVGTIAIEDADDGDFEWDIPEGGDICTQQFPNGLCGHDLDGEYYIRATLRDDGTTLDSDKSGIFNIED